MGKIELKGVEKTFGDVASSRASTSTIDDGEFVVFVGPSGCGKSTLLRLIAGLEDATGGAILIDGVDVIDVPPAKRGLVDGVPVLRALSAHDACATTSASGSAWPACRKAELDQKVEEAARDPQPHPLSRPPAARSSPAASASASRSAAPSCASRRRSCSTSRCRTSTRRCASRCALEIARLHETLGTTMIYVTHDQVEAMTLADKIVVLNAGKIEQVGTPLELYHHPDNLFVAGFIGSPKMNLLAARAVDSDAESVTVELADGDRVRVNVAPARCRTASRDDRRPAGASRVARAKATSGRGGGRRAARLRHLLYIAIGGEPLLGRAPTARTPPACTTGRRSGSTPSLPPVRGRRRAVQRAQRHPLADIAIRPRTPQA